MLQNMFRYGTVVSILNKKIAMSSNVDVKILKWLFTHSITLNSVSTT